jgi:Tfp pilus assembly protein PilO
MDLEDVKDRYKLLPMAARLGVAVIVGVIPIAYLALDEGTTLTDQLSELQGREQTVRDKFERSRQRKASLPKLEEQLAFTEEQLAKAKKLLPERIRVEDILQKVATIARDVGVQLTSFTPKPEVKQDTGYPSIEIPIETQISGRFVDVAAFIDRLVRLETTVFVRSISMNLAQQTEGSGSEPSNTLDPIKNATNLAKEARQKAKEKATLVISAYRSQTEDEIAAGPMEKVNVPDQTGKVKPKPSVNGGAS